MTDDRRTFLKGIGTMSALVAAGCAAPSRGGGARSHPMQLNAMHQRLAAYETHGWGFGGLVVTGADDSGAPGTYGWDGGLGTSFRADRSARS